VVILKASTGSRQSVNEAVGAKQRIVVHLQNKPTMIRRRKINDGIVFDIDNFQEESDLERICDLLSNLYSISVISKMEGPGTTIWELELGGYRFMLVNNTWGNFLKPETKESLDFVEMQKETLNRLLM